MGRRISALAALGFIVTAALLIPARSRSAVSSGRSRSDRAHGGPVANTARTTRPIDVRHFWGYTALLILAGCVLLFTSQCLDAATHGQRNGGTLPRRATILIGACIVMPQIIVRRLHPGRPSGSALGAGRACLVAFAAFGAPRATVRQWHRSGIRVAAQVLDGITASTLGIMVPLRLPTSRAATGRFNLAWGSSATAMGDRRIDLTDAVGYLRLF